MRGPRHLCVAIVVALGGVGLAACSPGGGEPVADPEVKAALSALGSQPTELWSAHEVVRRDCMRKQGFDLPFSSVGRVAPRGALVGVDGLFSSEAAARAIGYSSTTRDAASEAELLETRLANANRQRYENALYGEPREDEELALSNGAVVARSKTGCLGEADTRVFGSALNALHVMEFQNEINFQADRVSGGLEGALKEPLKQYSQCMSQAGYPVSGLDAGETAKKRFGVYRNPGDPPSAEEQAMAVADFRCQQQSGIVAAINEAFLSKSGEWATANETTILANYEILQASISRAKQILAQT